MVDYKHLQAPSEYLYNTLFLQGKMSDIEITMLSKTWALHKAILTKQPYFQDMIERSRDGETVSNSLHIDIKDPRATENGLQKVLCYIYTKNIELTTDDVVEVIGAAHSIQEFPVVEKCSNFMMTQINELTVYEYCDIAEAYEQDNLLIACKEWLRWNFTSIVAKNPKLLKYISIRWMKIIISEPYLFVNVELQLYEILRQWMFLQLTNWKGKHGEYDKACVEYFKAKKADLEALDATEAGKTPVHFLDTKEGKPYAEAFRKLRLQYCISDIVNIKSIEEEKIIPKSWLVPIECIQYETLLSIDKAENNFRPTLKSVLEPDFEILSYRCGHVVENLDHPQSWRLNFFNHRFYLNVNFWPRNARLRIQRRLVDVHASMNEIPRWTLMYKLRIAHINDNGLPEILLRTPIKVVSFNKQEIKTIECIKKKAVYPMKITMLLLFAVPRNRNFFLQQNQQCKSVNQIK